MYNLFELLKGIEYRLSEYKNEKIYVTGVAHDSREVLPGNIFICKKKKKKDGFSYIKEAEKISDFLRAIEAYNAVLNFEDVRIFRDIRNSENRLNNCEIANETKTIAAAQRQIDNIELIDLVYGIDSLPERLQYVARLRLEFPEENLTYLSEIATERGMKLTKSGVNHRMRKLSEMAEEIRENQQKRSLEK